MNLGPTELIVLLVIMLFVFGPKRIPEIGKSVGEALTGFRKATRQADQPLERHKEPESPKDA